MMSKAALVKKPCSADDHRMASGHLAPHRRRRAAKQYEFMRQLLEIDVIQGGSESQGSRKQSNIEGQGGGPAGANETCCRDQECLVPFLIPSRPYSFHHSFLSAPATSCRGSLASFHSLGLQ